MCDVGQLQIVDWRVEVFYVCVSVNSKWYDWPLALCTRRQDAILWEQRSLLLHETLTYIQKAT